jgi:2'-5' RNA ligase
MSRVFLAVPVPAELMPLLLKVKAANLQVPRVVWTRDHNLHLTVFFMGHVPRSKVDEMISHIAPVAAAQHKFSLGFDSICFAPTEKPRMIWARWKRSEDFTQFAHSVYTAARQVVPDLHLEHKDPIPHITLARFSSTVNREPVSFPETGLDRFPVSACQLYESVPAESGVKYECVHKFSLL